MRRTLALFAVIFTLWGCTKSQDPPKDDPKDSPAETKVETYKVTSQEVTSSIDATGKHST